MTLVDIVNTSLNASLHTAVSRSSVRHMCNNANCRNNPALRKKNSTSTHNLCGSCVESREKHRLRRLSQRKNYLAVGKMNSICYTPTLTGLYVGQSYVRSSYGLTHNLGVHALHKTHSTFNCAPLRLAQDVCNLYTINHVLYTIKNPHNFCAIINVTLYK